MSQTRDQGRPEAPSARVAIRVSPGAMRSEVVGRYGQGWRVRVAAPPERGRANDALLGMLADVFAVPRRRLRLVAGAAARDKVVEVMGITPLEAERLLSARSRKGHE